MTKCVGRKCQKIIFVFHFGIEFLEYNLDSSTGLCSLISKTFIILIPWHHVFHTLDQNDILLVALIFFAPFRSYSIASSVARVNLTCFNTAIFSKFSSSFYVISLA